MNTSPIQNYEGRDLLKIEDIQGAQSSATTKHRNISQEKYMPEVIRHVPNNYQRQADLQKNMRNPLFNDFRYNLKQLHPQFQANSIMSSYQDSLDDFKTQQAKQENEILLTNSSIDYNFIRMQKNKNSFDKLNPPFANFHSEIENRHLQNLSSPLLSRLKKIDQIKPPSSKRQQFQYVDQHYISPSYQLNKSASQSNISTNNSLNYYQDQKKEYPQIKQLPASQNHNENSIYYQNNNLNVSNQSIQQHSLISTPKRSQNRPDINQNSQQSNSSAIPEQLNFPEIIKSRDISIPSQQKDKNQIALKEILSGCPSPSKELTKYQQKQFSLSLINNFVKNLKEVISTEQHNQQQQRTFVYSKIQYAFHQMGQQNELMKYKYDRQIFKNFDQRTNAPVEIIKRKNDSMNQFKDYSTWNQQYGDRM